MARCTAEEAARTREALLDAALEVFYEQGVASPSLTRVAERAGYSRGAVYGHFANKNDLFGALCDRYLMSDEALEAYRSQVAADPLQGLCDWVQGAIDRARHDPERRMLMEILFLGSEAIPGDGIRSRLASDGRRGVRHQRLLLEAAVEAGQLPATLDAEAAAWAIDALLIGAIRSLRLHGEQPVAAHLGSILPSLLSAPALRGSSEG